MKYKNTLRKICSLSKVTPCLISDIFNKHEGIEVEVTESNDFQVQGFSIKVENEFYFVTERQINHYNKKYSRITNLQKKTLNLAIPIPLYLGQGDVFEGIYKIINSSSAKEKSNQWLVNNFCLEIAITYLLTYLLRYFSESKTLGEYKTIILESIEAYYLGMDNIAVISLLPVFEGGLRNLQVLTLGINSKNVKADEFDKGLRNLLLSWGRNRMKKYSWHPGKNESNEKEIDFLTHAFPQADVINSFRIFFSEVLYKNSDSSTNSLNRHIILHLLKNDFNNPSNFIRMFLLLTHIVFIESLSNQSVPFFWCGYDNDKDVENICKYIETISSNTFSLLRNM